MSGLEITCGRLAPWGPLNGPRSHNPTYSISKVYKKRKSTKRKAIPKPDDCIEIHEAASSAKKQKTCQVKGHNTEHSAYSSTPNSVVDTTTFVPGKGTDVQDCALDHLQPNTEKRGLSLSECWELDSGFASEASPPSSGRCSPFIGRRPAKIVAMDCEMVGTGREGHRSELARCSVLDYDGEVLYDQYIQPCHRVTNYRTRWSGIRKHHLEHAVPFEKARKEVGLLLCVRAYRRCIFPPIKFQMYCNGIVFTCFRYVHVLVCRLSPSLRTRWLSAMLFTTTLRHWTSLTHGI